MRRIPLWRRDGTVAAYAVVDDDAWPELKAWRWSLNKAGARRGVKRGRRQQTILMHRQIMGFPAAEIDHIDGNKLNNRRQNLRLATRSENMQNRTSLGANNTSGYRGVYWAAHAKKWRAQVRLQGRQHYLGYFNDPAEAAKVASDFRARHMTHTPDSLEA